MIACMQGKCMQAQLPHESSQAYDWTFSYTSALIAYMIGIAKRFCPTTSQNKRDLIPYFQNRQKWTGGFEPTTSTSLANLFCWSICLKLELWIPYRSRIYYLPQVIHNRYLTFDNDAIARAVTVLWTSIFISSSILATHCYYHLVDIIDWSNFFLSLTS